jgi:hypothetical protein
VVSVERGPWRDIATDFPPSYAPDEVRYAVELDLFVRTPLATLSFRNKPNQTALPARKWEAFRLPNGVGGGGLPVLATGRSTTSRSTSTMGEVRQLGPAYCRSRTEHTCGRRPG